MRTKAIVCGGRESLLARRVKMLLLSIDMCEPGAIAKGKRMLKRIEAKLEKGDVGQSTRDELESLHDELAQLIRSF